MSFNRPEQSGPLSGFSAFDTLPWFLNFPMGMFTGGLRLASFVLPGADSQTKEMQNQLHAVEWFALAEQRSPRPPSSSLAGWLARADSIELDHRPWTTEGIAFYAAREEFKKGPRKGWLIQDSPEWTRTVLHTGLGMALAELTLTSLPNRQKMAEAIAAFSSLCITNSQPGYEGCALESIGLYACHMHGARVQEFDRLLADGAPDLREYFWHGFGRGSYLSPGNCMPWSGSGWRAIEAASAAAPDAVARRNAISGASWAFTLVNLRTPDVMERFLKEHEAWVRREPAFADGVRSALMVWRQLQPQDPPFRRLESILSRYFNPVKVRESRGPTFRFDTQAD